MDDFIDAIMKWNWPFLFTLLLSGIAIYQSYRGIKNSNKQHLFDSRIETYMIFRSLYLTYVRSNVSSNNGQSVSFWFDADDNQIEEPNALIHFKALTDIDILYDISNFIDDPSDVELRRLYADRLNKLVYDSKRLSFLFKTDYKMSVFIKVYSTLIYKLCEYEELVSRAKTIWEKPDKSAMFKAEFKSYDDLVNSFDLNLPARRAVIDDCIKTLDDIVDDFKLNDRFALIEKEIGFI